jgi:outer membrane protein assembly factor BamA
MQYVSVATLAVAGLTAWLLLAQPAVGQEALPSTQDLAAARAELERRGATIGAVNVIVDDVFDPNDPEEDKALYRLANRLHLTTRESVIDSALLFHSGDPFAARLLEESARSLRALGFIAATTIEPTGYDAATNRIDVDVRVRDSWTLATDLKFHHSGGLSEWGAGLEDRNLLGMGKALKVSHRSLIERDETFISYTDPHLLGSRVQLATVFADASDGYRRDVGVERPFYSLDTRWSLGGSVGNEQRTDTIYDLGEEIDEFQHDLRRSTLQGGWSKGLVDGQAQRWLLGVTAEEHRFQPTLATPQPLLLPADRKLVYPWIGWQLVEDDYREMTELNDLGRTEDISLGLNLFFQVGFAKQSFGSDRDATVFRASGQTGWEPGGSGRLLLLDVGGSTRHEDTGPQNSRLYVDVNYYRRNLEKHLFSVSLSALATNHLDAEEQVLLGGDSGLRGYPVRYQAGKQRTMLTVEQRFFTDWYPLRLFRVGYAVFADAGQVRGRDPRASSSQGTLYDVGMGLRLSSPRASGRSIVHLDLAFPLNGDPSIDNVQFIVETKGSF